MKIELELPEWVDERGIHIIAGGIEEVAKKRTEDSPWEIKLNRCNSCGRCCMNVPDKWPHGKNQDTGYCLYLECMSESKWRCSLKENMPNVCCISDGEGAEYCNITWKTI